MQIDEDTRKAAGITDQQYINQFPFEACLVMKHHLAETVQKVKITNFCFTWVIAPLVPTPVIEITFNYNVDVWQIQTAQSLYEGPFIQPPEPS